MKTMLSGKREGRLSPEVVAYFLSFVILTVLGNQPKSVPGNSEMLKTSCFPLFDGCKMETNI